MSDESRIKMEPPPMPRETRSIDLIYKCRHCGDIFTVATDWPRGTAVVTTLNVGPGAVMAHRCDGAARYFLFGVADFVGYREDATVDDVHF